MKKIPVIIDTDPGVDDLLALKAALSRPELDVRLLCSVAGNVEISLTTRNTAFIRHFCGADCPVAKGESSPMALRGMDAGSVHGDGGIGGFTPPEEEKGPDRADGIEAEYEVIKNSDEKITLITLGPLTNIARLFERHPDAVANVDRIYAMVASVDGTGNITPWAEFNAVCDAPALKAVAESGVPMVISPMQSGHEALIPKTDFIEAADAEFAGLLEQVFSKYNDPAAGEGLVAMYDANAVETLIRPELYDFTHCRVEVDTGEKEGQTFLIPDPDSPHVVARIRDVGALTKRMVEDICQGAGTWHGAARYLADS